MGACICENLRTMCPNGKKEDNVSLYNISSQCTEVSLCKNKLKNINNIVTVNKPILNKLIMKNRKV